MVTDRNAGRRRREPGGTSMRPRPEPWPRRSQRRRIMRREQPCDHERPHRRHMCGTAGGFKAAQRRPPQPSRSCTKHACRSHRCFCTDASPGQLQSMLFATYASRGSANRANLRLQRFVSSPDGAMSLGTAVLVLGNFLSSRAPHKAPGALGAVGDAPEASRPLRLCAGFGVLV